MSCKSANARGWQQARGLDLVQTKQSHKHKALQSCGGSPPLGEARKALFAESSTAMRARSHTHTRTHTRNSCEMSRLGGGLLCGEGDEPRPAPPLREHQTHAPPPGTGGRVSDKPETTTVTAPRKGGGRRGAPAAFLVRIPAQTSKDPQLHPHLPRRRLHGCLKDINPPPTAA